MMTTAPLAALELSGGTMLGYTVALAVSGLLMVVLGAIGLRQTIGMRIFDVLIGLGFLGYAFYLLFLFDGGSVFVFYYAFILPVVLIVRAFRSRSSATG